MEVVFRANSRVLGYRPGQIVKIDDKDLTGALRALLARGRHLILIDPLSLDAVEPVRAEEPVEEAPKKTRAKTKAKVEEAEVVEAVEDVEPPAETEVGKTKSFSFNKD